MESFDRSLRHLLSIAPAEVIGFGQGQAVQVHRPVDTTLRARRRDVDGCFLVGLDGRRVILHVEFHRRHQALEQLALDVAEAQLRLYRREQLPVLSQVWDLYGRDDEPVLSERELLLGPVEPCSRLVYRRVNLRGTSWRELIATAPPSLWSLVPLTRDGRSEEALHGAHDAITRRQLTPGLEADQLAVLWFVAEAEQVSVELLKEFLTRDKLMKSRLYQEIFSEGEARGEQRGREQGHLIQQADTIQRLLTARLGYVDLTVRQRVRAEVGADTLAAWYQEALLCTDAESARRLADKIQHAPVPENLPAE